MLGLSAVSEVPLSAIPERVASGQNDWSILDGRSILVAFDPPALPVNWGWFGMRSSGEGMEFATTALPWSEHNWLRSSDYIMAAQPYTPPVGGVPKRMLMGVGV